MRASRSRRSSRCPRVSAKWQLHAGRYACTLHLGSYAKLGDSWARLMGEWLPKSGERVRRRRELRDLSRNTPETRERGRPQDRSSIIAARVSRNLEGGALRSLLRMIVEVRTMSRCELHCRSSSVRFGHPISALHFAFHRASRRRRGVGRFVGFRRTSRSARVDVEAIT